MDFQSPDDIEATKAQKRTAQKSPSTKTPHASHRSSAASHSHAKSTIKSYFQPIPKSKPNHDLALSPNATKQSPAIISTAAQVKKESPEVILAAEKELERLLSPQKYENSDHDDDDDNDNNNDIDSDDFDYEEINSTMRKSAYMSEKSSKKQIYKDGEIVLSRLQRKDKGKPRFTAYMLWSKEVRQEMLKSNPNLDFAQASRRLSSMWAIVPNNEKNIWRRRAKRVTVKNKRALKTGEKLSTKYLNRPGQKKPGRKPKHLKDANVVDVAPLPSPSPTKKAKIERKSNASTSAKRDEHPSTSAAAAAALSSSSSPSKQRTISKLSNSSSSSFNSTILPNTYKVTGIGPTDVAAHLKLLGDNLTIIGQRLKEHEVNG